MNSHHGIPRILTVDDRSENLLAYGALLKGIQCEVIACNSGPKAVEYLAEHEVALILLDVQMPVMDGFEAAKRIREMPHHNSTPILFVTASDHDRQQILKAARLKVADVIYKPIDVEVFLAKIQIFLDLYESKEFKKIKNQTTFIEAPGEVSKKYQEKDWSQTTLGPLNQWPLSLKTMVGVMLNSKFPAYILWGPDQIFLFNDAYTLLLADKNPHALGADFKDVWPEIWETLEPLIQSVYSGKSSYFEDFPLKLYRNGQMQEGYFNFSYSPIRDDSEEISGLLCTCIETTEQKNIQRQILRSEKTLDQIFHDSPSFMAFLRTPNFIFERANNEFLSLIGKKDVVGKTVLEILPEVESQGFIELMNQVARDKKPFFGDEIRIDFNLESGQTKTSYVDFVYQPMINPDGETYGIVCQGYDVTEKVLTRKQVEESEAFLKLITDSIPDFISYIDADEKYQFVNPAYESWFHTKSENLIGRSLKEMLGDTYEKSVIHFHKALAGEAVSFENELHDKDGNTKKVNVSYIPDFDPYKKVLGVVVVGHDTTAIRQANERLSKIQSISSSLTKSLTIKDIAHVVVNEGVPATGAAAGVMCLQDTEGLHLNIIHSSGYDDQLLGQYEKIAIVENFPLCEAIKSDMPIVIQPNENLEHKFPNLLLKTDWHTRKALVAFPIKIRGRTLGVLGLTYDFDQIVDQNTLNLIQTLAELTGQAIDRAEVYEKEIAARLSAEVAKDEAERANMLKSAFLANMSHEIRTPLGAMIGFADLLKDPRISPEEHASYIEILLRNGEQLSVIINDILDLSKVEAGHLTLEYFEAHPDLIASEVVSLLKMKAKEKNLELTYITHESTPTTVTSDPTRIRQILLNLVGNAIKFTHSGGIYITSFGHVNEDGITGITFEIKDTGIGIPNEQKDRVFEMFVQADGSMTRRFGGTGLGLALSRRLARAMGGDVKVKDSKLGEGSIFSVTIESRPELLQASRFNQPAISESNEAIKIDALQDVRVLVVDDAPDNQFLIRSFLSKRGAQVDSAENGLEGYKKALIGGYDIVLMDIQMPVMDGYTATQKLRDHGYKKPIIALTAHAMNEVAKKCLNVGCTDHLAKPIDSKQLIRTIARYSIPH